MTLCSKYIFNLTATCHVSGSAHGCFFSGFTDLIGEKDISDIIKSALGDFTSTVGQVKRLTHATIISETWKQLQQLKPCFFFPYFCSRQQHYCEQIDKYYTSCTSLYTSTVPAHYTSHRGNMFFGKQERFFQRYGSPIWCFDSPHRRQKEKFHETLGRVEHYTSTDTKKIQKKTAVHIQVNAIIDQNSSKKKWK